MPFVKVTYPHKRGGVRYESGQVYFVSSDTARTMVADGKARRVKLSPKEVQAWVKSQSGNKPQRQQEEEKRARAKKPV